MTFDNEYLKELENASQMKQAVYNYLYRVFVNVPTNDFVGVTKQFNTLINELASFLDSAKLKEAVNVFNEYDKLESSATDIDKFLEKQNVEYTSLFLLGGSSVPTSASVYLSSDGLIKGNAWEKIVAIYNSRKFKMPEDFKEPEDHIAIELLYLQKLNEAVYTVIQDGTTEYIMPLLKDQKTFLDENILPWANKFADALAQKANKDNSLFYASALVMTEFLQYDRDLIEEFALEND